jgi:hypothetical protein
LIFMGLPVIFINPTRAAAAQGVRYDPRTNRPDDC